LSYKINSEAPLEFVRGLRDVEVKEDAKVRLECELNRPDSKVEWFKDGEKLDLSDPNIKVESDGPVYRLTISGARLSDAAKYTVRTSGPTTSGKLFISGKDF
jgi:hypothetical protein